MYHWSRLLFFFVISCLVCPSLFAGNNIWSSGGPFTASIGGFSFAAGRIYATNNRALYRSLDNGRSWKRIGALECCQNIIADPLTPTTLYGTGGLIGADVFQSNDQGNTWLKLSEPGGTSLIDLDIHPSNPDILYTADANGRFFKSTNGGQTWKVSSNGLPGAGRIALEVETDPADGRIVYFLLGGKLFKSTDTGTSWKAIGPRGLDHSRMAIDPQNSSILYSAAFDSSFLPDIFRSQDGGSTWQATNCGCEQPIDLSIDPSRPQNVYVADYSSVIKTTNGGGDWKRLAVPFADDRLDTSLSTVAVHPSQDLVFTSGTGLPGIFRSANGGASWLLVRKGLDNINTCEIEVSQKNPAHMLAFSSAFVGTPLGFSSGLIFQSRNGGRSWALIKQLARFYVLDAKIHPTNPNLVVAVMVPEQVHAEDWLLAISKDAGRRWTIQKQPEQLGPPLILDPQNSNTIFLGGFRSTDLGKTFTPSVPGIPSDMVFDPQNPNNVYAVLEDGRLFKSTNGGIDWQLHSRFFRGRLTRVRLVVDPSSSRILYASSPKGIFKSTDGGIIWKKKVAGIPGSIAFSGDLTIDSTNPQIIYSAFVFLDGRTLMFISRDGAEKWSPFDMNGLGSVNVGDLEAHPNSSDVVFAATSFGVFGFTRKANSTDPDTPVIEELSTHAAPAGEEIEIHGRNFGSVQTADSKVFFGNVDAGTATNWTDSEITINVPSNAEIGSLRVQVGSLRSNSFQFVVISNEDGIFPSSGNAGSLISIVAEGTTGVKFDLFFNDVLVTDVRPVQEDVYVCTVPPGDGNATVRLFTNSGQVNLGTFQYN